MGDAIGDRARRHAALGDPVRLAIADELAVSDRAPSELSQRFDLPGNLLAHHLDVLERAGLVERFRSAGDGRRRYVRLRHDAARGMGLAATAAPTSVLFVCTHSSARSQLAAALWTARTGGDAAAAGTHPADAVHPGAVAAARRAGVRLAGTGPRHLDDAPSMELVVTVCDRAHEELAPPSSWWHWSVADPVELGTDAAFDAALADLDDRIRTLLEEHATP